MNRTASAAARPCLSARPAEGLRQRITVRRPAACPPRPSWCGRHPGPDQGPQGKPRPDPVAVLGQWQASKAAHGGRRQHELLDAADQQRVQRRRIDPRRWCQAAAACMHDGCFPTLAAVVHHDANGAVRRSSGSVLPSGPTVPSSEALAPKALAGAGVARSGGRSCRDTRSAFPAHWPPSRLTAPDSD